MSTAEQSTQLKNGNNATYRVVNGVTYFKLRSEFEGDYTKNCGLLGEEIDQNFYFLRGNDIKSIDVDENRNLIIKRVDEDYEPLVVNIGEELGQPTFELDKEKGELVVTYPDGTKSRVPGFLIAGKDVRMATDSTLQGDGTMYKPLGLSPIAKTGTYAPANEYFDISNTGVMPEGKGKGYRIVTKESIDDFGQLYPYDAVESIQKKLVETQSQWRIPSKDDWDELLNAFECDDADKSHSATTSTYLGKNAGRALKSAGVYHYQMGDGDGLWKDYPVSLEEETVYGQDVAGLAMLPLGMCPERNSIMKDFDADAEGFGKLGSFWTTTSDEDEEIYVKTFSYNSGKVRQSKKDKTAKMSIRLLKDYTYSNYNVIENILGFPYPTELVYSPYEGNNYVKIWTSINVYDTSSNLNGSDSKEWSAVTTSDRGIKKVFFINEWDGTEWHKKPMSNGDSVVIISYSGETENRPYHEWRMIDDVLIDTADALVIEFEVNLKEINDKIAALSASTKNFIQDTLNEFSTVYESISGETSAREEADEALETLILQERAARISGDTILQNNINDEVSARTIADINLQDNINIEKRDRIVADGVLQENIDKEAAMRSDMDIALQQLINQEIVDRKNADTILSGNIITEANDRMAADNVLSGNIITEKGERESGDSALGERIDNEIAARIANDITLGEYTLKSNETMTLPTNGEEIDDVKIKISDDFFNFGTF